MVGLGMGVKEGVAEEVQRGRGEGRKMQQLEEERNPATRDKEQRPVRGRGRVHRRERVEIRA